MLPGRLYADEKNMELGQMTWWLETKSGEPLSGYLFRAARDGRLEVRICQEIRATRCFAAQHVHGVSPGWPQLPPVGYDRVFPQH
jgi:hypothetical protein